MKLLFVILLVQLNYSMENTSLCSICQEDIKDGEKTRTTLCDHQFHKECINDWVDNRKPNCPICREKVNSQRELIEAVKGEKLLECIELLIEGVDIDGGDKDGFNALSHAVYQQHYETVNILLGNGAKVDPLDKNEDTPLIYAAAQNNENIVKILLQAGAAVDHVDKDKWTALMTAACYHHSEIVQILLRHGANSHLKNRNGYTAQYIAGDDKLTQKVFKDFDKEKQKVRAELEAAEKRKVQHIFLDAVKGGDVSTVQDLITKGADVNSFDFFGFTALFQATLAGNEALVKVLLEQKPNVNCRLNGFGSIDDGSTCLHIAARLGHATIVKMLLDEGAYSKLKNYHQKTALDLAENEDCKQLLETEDFKSTEHTKNLNRMFFDAAKEGNVSRIQYLIANGAQINSVDSNGDTALLRTICSTDGLKRRDGFTILSSFLLWKEKMEKMLTILLDYDLINVNCRTNNHAWNSSMGSTPLHCAASLGYVKVLKMLLDKCADPKLKNYYGLTALDVADDTECKIILKNYCL